jgi:hypothetical protein
MAEANNPGAKPTQAVTSEQSTAWFSTGFNEAEQVAAQEKARREKRQLGKRFYLKDEPGDDPENPRNEGEVIIIGGVVNPETSEITSDPFALWEHFIELPNGDKENYTCMRRLQGGCPFCDKGIRRTYVACFSILDCHPWVDDEGNLHEYERRLLVAKQDAIAAFNERRKLRGTLVGSHWKVIRTGERAFSIGDMWEFLNHVNLNEIVKQDGTAPDITVIDYRKALAPLDRASAIAAAAQYNPANDRYGRKGNKGQQGRAQPRRGGYAPEKPVQY